MITRKVWYRSSEGSKIEDRGTLTVGDGGFRFEGKKGTVAAPVSAARIRPVGFQNWVHVSYEAEGESRDAYFICSQMLGWVGVLGANKKLAEALGAKAR
jgi:hypothetical protein